MFQHPPPTNMSLLPGGTIRLTVPPMYGVEIDLTALTREESAVLAADLARARDNEVLITIPDAAPAYTGGGLTVSAVSGLSLTLAGWSGTWWPGKRLSILSGGRRYLVPTTGNISSGVVQMTNAPRVTFASGDAVTYNSPQLQGFLMNAEEVIEQIEETGVCMGMTLMVREAL